MTQDNRLNELVGGLIKRTQDRFNSLSESEQADFLTRYAITEETAYKAELGVYSYDDRGIITEILDEIGGDVENVPDIAEHALIIPNESADGDPCFMVVEIENGRISEYSIIPNRPVWVNPYSANSSTTYITENIGDALALTDVGESVVYVPLSEGPRDVPAIKDRFEDPHDYIVTRNNRYDESENRLTLRAYRKLNPVLSIIGKGQYKTAEKNGGIMDNPYISPWTIHKHDLAETLGELATAINADYQNSAEIHKQQLAAERETLVKFQRSATFGTVHDNVFSDEIRKLSNRQIISTGLDRLDKNLGGGIAPGSLYVIGAAPSTGKTSFCVQMADEIVQQGYNVLFVSLEQTETELIAKTISRLTFELARYKPAEALTTNDLLFKSSRFLDDGPKNTIYNKAINSYHIPAEKYGFIDTGRLFVIRSGDDVERMRALAGIRSVRDLGKDNPDAAELRDIYGQSERLGVRDLRDLIEAYAAIYAEDLDERKRHPVIFVDYLQIMKPENPDLSDKQNADLTISGLRCIVADFGVSLVAISSLNRSGYTEVPTKGNTSPKSPPAPTMANLKESGGIEYGADVILVLYDKGRGDTKKDKVAKRTLCVRSLKNRNGPTGRTTRLNYYPAYNLFSVRDVEDPTVLTEIEDGDPDEE